MTFALFVGIFFVAAAGHAQAPARFTKVIFGSPAADLADFERFATRAKKSGATHINVTAEDLPWSRWQYDTAGDPYPSWVISNTGLLKVAVPKALEPYIPADYSAKVLGILEARCKVLRRLGLKAAFTTFEPQMLPEGVFRDHPLWRGARVDHPARSRVARFAPTVDNPEVLALYRESLGILIRRCPEIELISMRTNDSGTGLDWSGGLYSGRLGNTLYQNRPMEARFRDFFAALQEGARSAGGRLEIDMIWTREPDPRRIASQLSAGMAVENLEGPGATPFKASAGYLLDYENFFYPVRGLPQPVLFLEGLEAAAKSKAPRLVVSMPDGVNRALYFEVFDTFWKSPPADDISRLTFLREVGASVAGAQRAGALLSIWTALREAERFGQMLNSGGTIFYLGSVQQRWLTRPFVPFPSELKDSEKEHYRKFQFQARSEADADNLSDLQASVIYSGWSGRHHVGRILREVESRVSAARRLAREVDDPMLGNRLEVFTCLIRNARNAVSYQAQLDRVRGLGIKPEPRPPGGTQSGWDRQLMLETARAEIDNTALLMQLLKSATEPLLHTAATKAEEDIRILGPDLAAQLQKKLDIMNAHWEDYKRIFTTPNL